MAKRLEPDIGDAEEGLTGGHPGSGVPSKGRPPTGVAWGHFARRNGVSRRRGSEVAGGGVTPVSQRYLCGR